MKLDELRERSSTKRETAEDAAKTFEESRIVEAQQLRASFHVGTLQPCLVISDVVWCGSGKP